MTPTLQYRIILSLQYREIRFRNLKMKLKSEKYSTFKMYFPGMYQEMVNDLQKRQRLDAKNVEKQAKINNLQGEVHLMENRYYCYTLGNVKLH